MATPPSDEAWHALFRVSVGDENIAVTGRYVVTTEGVEFHPAFPFDLGRRYVATFDPARLPSPRTAAIVRTGITFDAPVRSPSTSVTAIAPSAGVWPENMLRFYVYFSAPMSRGQGTRHVHLVDQDGHEVADAILAAYADLWNPDTTRLTVFFDPGRVKRGVGPNVAMGRAIVAGRRYAIVVDAAWLDAQGQSLTQGFRQEFTAGPPAYAALDVADWTLTLPRPATRDPLVVAFPAALDHALLDRAIGVESSSGARPAGQSTTGDTDATWHFTPDAPWTAGDYRLVVLTALEDPAGNKIGRAFEVLSSESTATAVPEAEVVRRPFEIR